MTLDGTIKLAANVYSLKFSYHLSHVISSNENEALFFDLDKEDKVKTNKEVELVLKDYDCPRDYLVIYVHFLPRVIKRLHSKGFNIILNLQNLMEIQYAILLDPNGIEVRLLEMPNIHLNDVSEKKQWFAKLGYYVIHVNSGALIQQYLEGMFSKEIKVSDTNKKMLSDSSGQKGFDARALDGMNQRLGQRSKLRTRVRDGICLVDSEVIVTGLTRTSYYWIGHATREKAFTLCFVDNNSARPWQVDVSTPSRRNHRLISIGIKIGCSISNALALLAKECAVPPTYTNNIPFNTQIIGYVLPINGIHGFDIDLCSTLEASETEPQKQHTQQSQIANKKSKPKSNDLKQPVFLDSLNAPQSNLNPSRAYINFNQKLRNTFSESAIVTAVSTDTPTPPYSQEPKEVSELRTLFNQNQNTDFNKRRNSY
ncbi:hypothetical protein HMI54_004066 [Coelomomyces lativittatus]|nr:hypothetical protein HMI56_006642 [Coelomomyces lativittatus]KAJ1517773.1 hypothetical protein HMI54_004066 [Coelomomyces lativittatus]